MSFNTAWEDKPSNSLSRNTVQTSISIHHPRKTSKTNVPIAIHVTRVSFAHRRRPAHLRTAMIGTDGLLASLITPHLVIPALRFAFIVFANSSRPPRCESTFRIRASKNSTQLIPPAKINLNTSQYGLSAVL